MKKNKITEILHHDVSWNVESDKVKELDECSIEYIEKLIKDGYSSGSLCVTYGKDNRKETTGYWHIINWRSVACDLYNAGKKVSEEYLDLEKAIEKFEEEWTF